MSQRLITTNLLPLIVSSLFEPRAAQKHFQTVFDEKDSVIRLDDGSEGCYAGCNAARRPSGDKTKKGLKLAVCF